LLFFISLILSIDKFVSLNKLYKIDYLRFKFYNNQNFNYLVSHVYDEQHKE
jgi:hypothetical protein